MQWALDTTGWSHVSIMDAALGVGAGFAVPIAANAAMDRITNKPEWVGQYQPQLAAAIGLVATIPLYFWRGFGPAVIGGMMAIAYGLADLVNDYLASGSTSTSGIRASRAMGVLSASPARRRLRASAQRRGLSGIVAAPATAFQGTTF